ncbi:MAG: YihY/virulence factor BrkB family protein [Marinilabiliales bacterium]|nr:YihY/virulence factor BrkB family protein [Marinilabiliales bacterium]
MTRLIVKGLFGRGVLVTRASSIAFNMLMALLPATIFLFTLIPFIPIPNFQTELIRLFENLIPVPAYSFLETTIVDVITNKSGTLLVADVLCDHHLLNQRHSCTDTCLQRLSPRL